MPQNFRNLLVLLLVILALIGFALICGFAFYETLTRVDLPKFSEPYIYVANILTGLVGGIVAVGFGVTPPPNVRGLLKSNLVSLGSFIVENQQGPAGKAPNPTPPKELIGAIYALVYILAGVTAIGIWIFDAQTPDLVKNLATVSIGMFVAIITAFFKDDR